MNDKVDVEAILKEFLDIIEKHSVPVKSIAIDISLLSHDFEIAFPQLKEYKAGRFFRSHNIDGIPASLNAKRRIPFNDIVNWLELNVLPFVKEVAVEVEQEHKEVKAHFQTYHYENHPRFAIKNNYSIGIECRLREEPEIEERNTVVLRVGVRQFDATSYPKLYGFVGWLVDEESGGDWGLETVYDLNPLELDFKESDFEYGTRHLPELRRRLINELPSLYDVRDTP